MLGPLGLGLDEFQVTTWIREKAPERLRNGSFDPPQQHPCAAVIEATLLRHPQSWGALTALGAATSTIGRTDFAKWRDLVDPGERPLVTEIAAVFEPLMPSQAEP